MKKLLLLLPLCALSGCTYLSAVGTQFKKMEEPQDGERARIRVVGNYVAMRGTPGSSCMDYRKKGAGTVIGGFIGSTGYRGRSLGMPNPNDSTKGMFSEFYVRANEPVTLEIAADITMANCSFPATFIPEAGHDYELQLGLQSSGGGSVCSIKGSEITGGVSKPLLSLRKTGECP